ncbi:hypothetical protein [Plantactinospora soyae]|uniref:Secreted protein n=1 Tax=Plantactinospora soyae TaxID=1544732 RepID=A0A927MAW2_9ACTN|nr:hypothetical protein [Plantactinospora soyae]MBE1487690.1 hypothetical protein [Plantactinospora soyae]
MARRHLLSGALAAFSAVAMIAVASTPAVAATTVSVRTTDGLPVGGTAIVWGNWEPGDSREVLGACDKHADGLRAYAEAQYLRNGQWQYYATEDADGANQTCRHLSLPNIPEGTTIHIKACLKDGPNGAQRYCGTGTAKA